MASIVEMYADESYGGDTNSGPLCLAMYLYEREQAIVATQEWSGVLNDPGLPRSLPYFRMSDCAHATGVFDGMGRDQCDRIARKIIPIAKTRSIVAFASVVDQGEYRAIVPKSSGFPNPYGFLAHMLLSFVREWIEETKFMGSILYNFESGHQHQSTTNRIMCEIGSAAKSKAYYAYAGHTFVEKEVAPIVQSADLYAWHCFTDIKRRARGLPMRKDLEALGRPQDKIQHWTADQLRVVVPYIVEYDGIARAIDSTLGVPGRNVRP